jgi:hypothetical protein
VWAARGASWAAVGGQRVLPVAGSAARLAGVTP